MDHRGMKMTTDAKQSLTAFAAVTSIFLFGYLFVQTTRGVEFPRWMPFAGLAIQAVNFGWWVMRHMHNRKVGPD